MHSLWRLWWPLKGPFVFQRCHCRLLGARVLGHGLGTLGYGMLGQFTRQKETDGCLDLSAGDGGTLVVVSEAAGFGGDALKEVVHEGVHDGHGLAGDTSVGVHLFQHFVNVDAVALPPPPLLLLVPRSRGFGLGDPLLGALACSYFRRHLIFV